MTNHLTVKIAFLDVGQGDTIIISIPETGEAAIVDCLNPDTVFAYLDAQNTRYIRGLIITHLHLDHYKGAVQFLENCELILNLKCERVIFNWPYSTSKKDRQRLLQDGDQHSNSSANEKVNRKQLETTYQRLEAWANQNKGLCHPLARKNDSPLLKGSIGDVIEVVQPWHGQLGKLQSHGLNNTSGILKVYGSHTSALLTGDIELVGWQELRGHSPDLLCSDVLKFPHHGAWKDLDVDIILDSVQPSVVVISVGTEGDKYQHPNKHVFDALFKRPHIRLLCTQVTNQCGENVLDKRHAIVERFKAQAAQSDHNLIISKHDCPCAGTVIIELGSQVHVLQPEIKFHHEAIIKSHFTNTHKCAI